MDSQVEGVVAAAPAALLLLLLEALLAIAVVDFPLLGVRQHLIGCAEGSTTRQMGTVSSCCSGRFMRPRCSCVTPSLWVRGYVHTGT